MRALLEGVASQVSALCTLVGQETGTALQRLKVDGGLTQSAVLMQALADIAQLEVEIFPSQHATPLGAVALARLALNPALGLADAVVNWAPERVFTPRWSQDQAQAFRAKWERAASVAAQA